MTIPTIIKEWNLCVKQAKQASTAKQATYGFVSGKVLKDARKCFCARSFIRNNK